MTCLRVYATQEAGLIVKPGVIFKLDLTVQCQHTSLWHRCSSQVTEVWATFCRDNETTVLCPRHYELEVLRD